MEDDRDVSDKLEGSVGDQPPSLMVEDFASCFVMTVWMVDSSFLPGFYALVNRCKS